MHHYRVQIGYIPTAYSDYIYITKMGHVFIISQPCYDIMSSILLYHTSHHHMIRLNKNDTLPDMCTV